MLRICSSRRQVSRESEVGESTVLFAADTLKIEGDEYSIVINDDRNGTFIFYGDLIGYRSDSGKVVAVAEQKGFIKQLAADLPLVHWVELLEGRFVAVQIRPDSKCDIVTDRFGKSELFYQKTAEGIVMATEMDLLPDPAVDGYDQSALVHVLSVYGFRPPKKHTLHNAVHRLGVGEKVELNCGELSIEKKGFIPLPVGNYGEREQNEYADAFLNAIESMGSRHGNVVYLSSGWDSSSILAGLVHVFGCSKVRAVTGRMRYSERSGVCNQFEIDRARKIADYFQVPMEIVEFDFMDQAPEFFMERAPMMRSRQLYSLTGLTHGMLADFVSRTTNGKEVAFAGEISDAAHNLGFSQYATIFHPVYDFREYSDKMASYLFGPSFLKRLINGNYENDTVFQLFRGRFGESVFDTLDSDTQNRAGQLLTSFFLRNGRIPLWSIDNVKMLTAEGAASYTEEMQGEYLKEGASALTEETLYSWYLHLYNSFHWQGSTVQTIWATADHEKINCRMPFYDSHIQEFLSAMPENWGRGLDLNPTKYPLKWMLQNRIDYPYDLQTGPHSYTYDVDHSFNHAIEVLYHSNLTPILLQALSDRPYHAILSAEVFNLTYLDSLVDLFLQSKEVPLTEINDLYALTMLCLIGWYK